MGYDTFEDPEPMCEEINQMLTDTELLKRERKAYRLIAEASVCSKSIPDICKIIITGLVKILKFDLGVIRLKDDKNNLFMVIASTGISGGLKKKLMPAFSDDSESITMLAVKTGKPVFAPDVDKHIIKQTHAARVASCRGKVFIAWPLRDPSQNIFGVTTLVSSLPKKNFDRDKTFFRTITNMLTLVIVHKMADENIKKSLKEKELLLKEIHHRVKNNMQVISSLVNLQASRIKEEDAKNLCNEIRDKIRSMAFVHEQLYKNRDLVSINFKDYIMQLSSSLMRSYCINPDKIELKIDAEGLCIGIDKAVPCGLIINELISNALKHAFPDDMKGCISIKLHKNKNGKFLLNIRDNGIGLNKDFNIQNTTSFGLGIVVMLVKQISGILKITGSKGTNCIIKFEE